MNYRHAFHAGNAADCVKHALLVWLVGAMQRKPGGFLAIDTHAGAGRSDLAGGAAARTGEWRQGIGRLWPDPPEVLLGYVALAVPGGVPAADGEPRGSAIGDVAEAGEADGPGEAGGTGEAEGAVGARYYLGSPGLLRGLLRVQDRLVCCELHPEEHAALRRLFAGDTRVGVHLRDGYAALRAFLPPAERRALVLIDPPFERAGEFSRLVEALVAAQARFGDAVLAAWYPIKHRAPVRTFHAALRESRLRDVVAAELWLRAPTDPERLNGCGLVVVRPPWRFEAAAAGLLAALLARLGKGEAGQGFDVVRLSGE